MISTSSLQRVRFIGSHDKIALLLLAGLFFFRVIVAGVLGSFIENRYETWIGPVSQLGIYLLTAILIWWERARLADFNIDGLAVAIILLFLPLQTLILFVWQISTVFTFPQPASCTFWAIAIGLAIALWSSRAMIPRPSRTSLGWFGIGAFVGVITAVLISLPNLSQFITVPRQSVGQLLGDVALRFPYQIGYAGVTEEPMFRGFLWGYLRKAGWRDWWICLFQSALFMFAHIYNLNNSLFAFWITAPLGALVLGFLVWRSRSISTSLAAHGAINAFAQVLPRFIASYR